MGTFILSTSLPLLLLAFLALSSTIFTSEAEPSFSFPSKGATFHPDDIALYGDAKIVAGGSSILIQLNDSASHGGGRVVYKKPIEFAEDESSYPGVFSTVLSFNPPTPGGRLGLVVFPVNGTFDQPFFQVKIDISDSFRKFGDSNVTVIVDGTTVPEKIRNVTVPNLAKEKDKLLYASVNYIAGGKFIEVRLSRTESFEHVGTMMFTWIDLSGMMKGEDEFMVGVKSYRGDFTLRYWSSETRRIPRSMHSYLLIDQAKLRMAEEAKKRRRDRMWGVATCFVMTFGSIGIVFFAVMHLWTALKRNIKTKEFEYEKMEKMEGGTKQERK